MKIIDLIFLLVTGLLALYLVWFFGKKYKEKKGASNIYFLVSFLVLLISGLLLIFLGWSVLKNNLVAVVASLIPFSLAVGLIERFYRKSYLAYLILMIIGLVLIAIARLGGIESMSKIVYPIFHGIAGLTIFFVPIFAVSANKVKGAYIWVTVGGALIGLGGIALSFLSAGRQFLFFSQSLVNAILAPLLFLMTLFFAIGFVKGETE